MYMAFYTMIPIRTGVVRDIRNQINRKITELPLGFFSEERKGDIIARVSGDVNEIETSIMSSLDMLFKNPILILIYLIGMIAISWQLTLFVFILLPFAGYVMGTVGKKLKRKSFEGQQQWGYLMSQIEETLGGLRVIKAFNAEAKIQDRFEKSNETFRRLTNRIYRRQQMAHPMSEFLGTATIAIVLWYGGTLILSSNSPIDASTFIYYLVIFYSIINPAKDLSKASYAIQKGLASMDRVDKILKAESNINDPEDPKPIALTESICYRDVWFKYQHEWVLKGIDLEVEEGELLTLLGPSGCGKSTLLRCLAGLEQVQQGHILLEGRDITDLDARQRQIGMVFQQYSLFPNMTVEQNMAFGLKIQRLSKAEINDRITEALAMVGLQDKADAYPAQLSGGQQQRVALARAIVTRPKVLLLDEPLSAIDAKLRKSLQVEIRRIQKQLNITTIFVTHDQDEAMVMSDRICLLNCGNIEQMDTPIAIYTHPRTKFAAGFIGSYNVLEPLEFGRVTGDIDLPAQPIAIRPEVLNIAREKQNLPGTYDIEGTVIDSTPRGNVLRYKVDVNGVQLSADTLFRSFSIYENGSKVWLSLEKRNCLHVEEEAV